MSELILSEKDNLKFDTQFKELTGMTINEFINSAVNLCSSEIAEFVGKDFTIGTSAYTGWWDVYKISQKS